MMDRTVPTAPRRTGARRVSAARAAALAVAVALLLGGCGSNGDGGDHGRTTPPAASSPAGPATSPSTKPSSSPVIGEARAEQLALKTVPGGKVRSSELGTENGRQVWEVEVTDARGTHRDVDIDATTGAVLPSEQDHDQDHDRDGDRTHDDHGQ